MSSSAQNPASVEAAPANRFSEFLESTPPGAPEDIADLGRRMPNGLICASEPEVQLHCAQESCNGIRFFRCTSDDIYLTEKKWQRAFMTYVCRNCGKSLKTYALLLFQKTLLGGLAQKIGEVPAFGPPTPARVISLVGPDRDLFLRGRRAENAGLGIGAFAYYRRVVENQKGRIIREIGRVAKKLGAQPKVLESYEAAEKETQFSKAIDVVKAGIPESLLIKGKNPLLLLHSALSEGLHDEEDENVCLELATSIRVVLTELAERISVVLSDQAELDNAVNRLLTYKAQKARAKSATEDAEKKQSNPSPE